MTTESERRRDIRIAVTRQGTLRLGDTSTHCVIRNICSRGFLIHSKHDLPVGKLARLTCELYPEESIECTVQVRHVNAGCLGALVVDITAEARALCTRFLEEQTVRPSAA
jgi:hypothetical protein